MQQLQRSHSPDQQLNREDDSKTEGGGERETITESLAPREIQTNRNEEAKFLNSNCILLYLRQQRWRRQTVNNRTREEGRRRREEEGDEEEEKGEEDKGVSESLSRRRVLTENLILIVRMSNDQLST